MKTPETPAMTREAAKRAASRAGGWAPVVSGLATALFGVLMIFVGVTRSFHNLTLGVYSPINIFVGCACLTGGLGVAAYTHKMGKEAAWLRTNGIPLEARILACEHNEGWIRKEIYRYTVEVAGPQGPYQTTFDRRTLSWGEWELPVGGEIRVRAKPSNLFEVIAEDCEGNSVRMSPLAAQQGDGVGGTIVSRPIGWRAVMARLAMALLGGLLILFAVWPVKRGHHGFPVATFLLGVGLVIGGLKTAIDTYRRSKAD
jgi:hypothetical protein